MSAQFMTEHVPPDQRAQAKSAAQWFNSGPVWKSLGRSLTAIWSKELFKAWGHSSYKAYCETELDIPKPTAADLRLAYSYLELHHREHTVETGSAADLLPSYTSLAIMARKRPQLPEETAEALDRALFAGTLTRSALKQAITQAFAANREPPLDNAAEVSPQSDTPSQQDHQGLIESLQSFYKAFDLPAIREQITAVFDGWQDVTGAERLQIHSRLLGLIDGLEALGRTIDAANGH